MNAPDVIDLTQTPPPAPRQVQVPQPGSSGNEIIDLTNVPLILGRPKPNTRINSRPPIRTSNGHVSITNYTRPSVSGARVSDVIADQLNSHQTNSVPIKSPKKGEKGAITCPVCLDTYDQVRSDGRQLVSTVCGHVFCNGCIEATRKAQASCPTCRKKLTKNGYHPIFL